MAKKSTHINIAVDIGITSFGGSVYIREHYLIVNKKFIFWAQKKGRSLEKNLEKTAQNDDVFGSSPVQRLALQKNIYKSHLKKWGRKNPETVAVSGFFGVISISVTLDGTSGDFRYFLKTVKPLCFQWVWAVFFFRPAVKCALTLRRGSDRNRYFVRPRY